MNDMRKYKDLFIDFDDTLYDTHGNAEIALAELFEHYGWERYFDSLQDFTEPFWQTNYELWSDYAAGRITRDYLIVERIRRPLAKGRGLDPQPEECIAISNTYLNLCSSKPGVVEGAHELVQYLKGKGYGLHLCSNGFHEVQYKKLKACGLEPFFDTVILSEDAGANKPDPRFFDYALQRTGAHRETTLMIGDNYQTDILGALGAGLDALIVKRWGEFDISDKPTYEVESLLEIKNIL